MTTLSGLLIGFGFIAAYIGFCVYRDRTGKPFF